MAKAVKLSDIAKRVGVSNVTVSKALADKSGVSEEKRAIIKEVAEEMGYIPTSASKSKPTTGNIGVLIPTWFLEEGNSFYWAMYQQVVTRLSEEGYYAILEILQSDDPKDMTIPNMSYDGKVDGIIVMGQIRREFSDFLWSENPTPVIFLDFYDAHKNYDSVISDGYYGMYIVTNYLIEMGHKRIGFVGTPLATSSITDRYFGYQKAMLENGLAIEEGWVIPDRDKDSGEFIEMIFPDELPTAFACNCDATAYKIIQHLKSIGVDVPKDASVGGFDNYLYPNLKENRITTYEVKMDEMAKVCVKTLIDKINERPYTRGIQIVTGELMVKKTVQHV